MRRFMWVALGIAVIAAVAVSLALRDRTTPIDVSYTGSVGTRPGDPGVYRYDTSGYESVDALAGARHDYPEVTSVVVEESSCGPIIRWEPLAQRRDEWRLCGVGPTVDRIVEFHEWFGIGETTQTECSGLSLDPHGERMWEATCSRPDTSIIITIEHVGQDTLVVGGEEIMTDHLRLIEVTSGRTAGSRTTDLWVIPGTPLYVRKQVEDRSTSDSPIGAVTYTERYLLQLRSLVPTG